MAGMRTMPSTASHGPLMVHLLAQLAFGLAAMTICIPSMQEWGAMFGRSQAAVQLTFSGYVMAFGGLQLLYGPLSDRLGRKRILLFGLLLAGAGSVLAALATDLPVLVLARVLQGAGSAAGMVVGRAMVQDLFDGAQRTRVMAFMGMTIGLFPPMATVLGGQLHVWWGWQANFVLLAVLAALMFATGLRILPDDRRRTHAGAAEAQPHWLRAMFTSYARLGREPAFLLHVAILASTTATFYAFLAGAPMVLGSYSVGPDFIGYYIMCPPMAYIVGNYLTTRMAYSVGGGTLIRLGQISVAAGLVLVIVLAWAGLRTPLAFALPLTLMGLGHGLTVPAALAGTVGLLPVLAGAAAAVAGLAQQIMGAVGGYVVGLVPHDGAANLAWIMLAFTLCGVVAQAGLYRRTA